jgi:penicillin-binding protein 2
MWKRDEKLPGVKLAIFQYLIVGILLILLFGCWRLQILGAQNYRMLAEQNRIRKVPILAPRGKILDREGRLIVDNYPSVSCFLVREQGRDITADFPVIARGLHMTVDDLDGVLRKYRTAPKYQPLPLKQDITPDEVEFIESHRDELPELETIEEERRLYPRDGFAAHVIGYVGEVSEQMLNDSRYEFYEPGDVVGKSGVEETYDQLLRGKDGSEDIIVDSHGREVGFLGREDETPGTDLKLTIDVDIQRAAEQALGPRNGAIVAMDPHTGEILAMVSHPTFDPNNFAVRIGRDQWNALITDPHKPLMNKAIQAQLAPGSTFKIIMSVAGLQEGVAQDMHVHCPGGGTFYGHYFKCHAVHGMVDIHHAIPWSCDTFYYTLAQKLGIDTIAKYASALGIGHKTGIDLPDEVTGIMPSTAWKLKNFHEKWYAGEVISVGIGQGAVTVTPLQLARAISGIASGGVLHRPHVVFPSEVPPEYRQAVLENYPGSGDAQVPIDAANWETITDGMAAVTQPGGTAAASHLEGIDFAGKTGTAQIASHNALSRMGGGRSTRPNAWFVGIAPRRNPDIVVAVLWENGEEGPYAARLAARVISAFVTKKRSKDNNLELAKAPPQPVEVGAVWSGDSTPGTPQKIGPETAALHAGHFTVNPASAAVNPSAQRTSSTPAAPRPTRLPVETPVAYEPAAPETARTPD